MDFTRVTSPSSIALHDNGSHRRKRSTSRSAGIPFSRSSGPMAVPNATYKSPPPPPPLPPPRFIDHVTAGSDPGWAWANDPGEGNFGKARESVKSISTFPKSWDRKGEEMKPVEGPEYQRRESSSSNVRSPTDTDRIYEFARHQDEGYYSLSGPRPSAMSQQSVYNVSENFITSCPCPLENDIP